MCLCLPTILRTRAPKRQRSLYRRPRMSVPIAAPPILRSSNTVIRRRVRAKSKREKWRTARSFGAAASSPQQTPNTIATIADMSTDLRLAVVDDLTKRCVRQARGAQKKVAVFNKIRHCRVVKSAWLCYIIVGAAFARCPRYPAAWTVCRHTL